MRAWNAIRWAALAAAASAAVAAGCARGPMQPTRAAAEPLQLAQVGYGAGATFATCAGDACPRPSIKTRVGARAPESSARLGEPVVKPAAIEIPTHLLVKRTEPPAELMAGVRSTPASPPQPAAPPAALPPPADVKQASPEPAAKPEQPIGAEPGAALSVTQAAADEPAAAPADRPVAPVVVPAPAAVFGTSASGASTPRAQTTAAKSADATAASCRSHDGAKTRCRQTGTAPQWRPVRVSSVDDDDKPLAATVRFAAGSALLDADAKARLESLSGRVAQADRVIVKGRTDDTGDADTNDRLALRRAMAVADHLRKSARGTRAQFLLLAKGRCCYAQAGTDKEARAANRRAEVEFTVASHELPPRTAVHTQRDGNS